MSEYRYLRPSDAWNERPELIGKPMARAYWVHSDRPQEATDTRADVYRFAFKSLADVKVSPYGNAYMLVFTDGTTEDLCSYDALCMEV